LGYELLGDDRVADAIEVFNFNVTEHPEYANGYDSLGEAYLIEGYTLRAITSYRRAFALDSLNMNARDMLVRLEWDSMSSAVGVPWFHL